MPYLKNQFGFMAGSNIHGFIGDEMFLGFGIEDVRTGGIDIRAEDLLKDMGLCFEG
jgi:hypothetical protein